MKIIFKLYKIIGSLFNIGKIVFLITDFYSKMMPTELMECCKVDVHFYIW